MVYDADKMFVFINFFLVFFMRCSNSKQNLDHNSTNEIIFYYKHGDT